MNFGTSNQASTMTSSQVFNPYAKKHAGNFTLGFPGHPVLLPNHQQRHPIPHARRPLGNLGGYGGQVSVYHASLHPTPQSPLQDGGSNFSIASDSLAATPSLSHASPPIFEPLPVFTLARSYSTSSGSSSSPIDLQAACPKSPGSHDESHEPIATGLLSTPVMATSQLTSLPNQKCDFFPPEIPLQNETTTTSVPRSPATPAGVKSDMRYSISDLVKFALNSDNLYGTANITTTTHGVFTSNSVYMLMTCHVSIIFLMPIYCSK